MAGQEICNDGEQEGEVVIRRFVFGIIDTMET